MSTTAHTLSLDATALAVRLAKVEERLADVLTAVESLPDTLRPAAAPELLTAGDVAAMLGVSRRTVDTLDAADELPIPVRIGRQRRWRRQAVLAWLDAGGCQ
ncbi:helix-turn-helix transcriptional regulator [Rubrivirga sp. IMCC43871]|uniref:helix-turn-helix transcriptional regulator n=1 Tax=Rubrivirga sp. IMCC43871 TaxID=3391575 RepID=UPI00399023ED